MNTVWVGGRRVKLCCRGGPQSVNICKPANEDGDYEEVQYLKLAFQFTVPELERFADLASFKAELRRRAYRQAS